MKKVIKREWLIEIRRKRNKSQLEVSQESEISRSFYANIELGVKDPSLLTQKKISDALKFNPRLFSDNLCYLKEQEANSA